MNSTCLLAQVGEDGRQVALDLQRRPRGLLERHAQLVGDDVGQRRLAQPRRPVEQHVVERLAARLGRLDGDLEVVLDLVLPDELAQPLRTQLQLERRIVVDRRGRDDAVAIELCRWAKPRWGDSKANVTAQQRATKSVASSKRMSPSSKSGGLRWLALGSPSSTLPSRRIAVGWIQPGSQLCCRNALVDLEARFGGRSSCRASSSGECQDRGQRASEPPSTYEGEIRSRLLDSTGCEPLAARRMDVGR